VPQAEGTEEKKPDMIGLRKESAPPEALPPKSNPAHKGFEGWFFSIRHEVIRRFL
jgi:hypothetical protein